jgi:hypothetical protein
LPSKYTFALVVSVTFSILVLGMLEVCDVRDVECVMMSRFRGSPNLR